MSEDIRVPLEIEYKNLKKHLPFLEWYRTITTIFLIFLLIGAFTIDVVFFFILLIPLIWMARVRRGQTLRLKEAKRRLEHLESVLIKG